MAMENTSSAAQGTHGDVDLMTEGEVAKALKVAPGSLRNARVNGSLKIPYIKLGEGKRSPVRYRRSDVSSYIDDRTVFNSRHAHDVASSGEQ